MQEAGLAILILGGFFVLRGVMATIFFFYLLPEGVNCPNCDAATARVQAKGWNLLMPRFRTSWCLACGWHGLLRESSPAVHADTDNLSQPGQFPESSKKSSK
jgi:hypothetical protein